MLGIKQEASMYYEHCLGKSIVSAAFHFSIFTLSNMITFTRKLYITFIVYMCVCLDFPQHWTKLDTTGGPRRRDSHAACCIAGPLTGQEHPLLLVGGGDGGSLSALKDMWLLDVDKGVWSKVSGLIVWCMMSYIKSVCYKYVLLFTYMWLCALNPGA